MVTSLSPSATATPAPSASPTKTASPSFSALPPSTTLTAQPEATATSQPIRITGENAARLQDIGTLRYQPWELVLALAWSPDGGLLAVAAGNSIYLYTTPDIEQAQALDVGAWTGGLAFSPDGSLLAAGGRDGEVRIWRKAPGERLFTSQPVLQWTAHKKGANQIAFSPDGRLLASGGNDAIARVWNVVDGSLTLQMIGGTFSIPALAFQPDGRYLAIVNGSVARLRELEAGRIGVTLHGEAPLFSLAFSPDGTQIATGNLDNQVEIWDAASGERIGLLEATRPLIDAPAVFSGQLAYSPDGLLLGATSSDGSLRLWEPASAQLLATLAGHRRAATCLAFNPDQSLLASGGLDATVRIWSIR